MSKYIREIEKSINELKRRDDKDIATLLKQDIERGVLIEESSKRSSERNEFDIATLIKQDIESGVLIEELPRKSSIKPPLKVQYSNGDAVEFTNFILNPKESDTLSLYMDLSNLPTIAKDLKRKFIIHGAYRDGKLSILQTEIEGLSRMEIAVLLRKVLILSEPRIKVEMNLIGTREKSENKKNSSASFDVKQITQKFNELGSQKEVFVERVPEKSSLDFTPIREQINGVEEPKKPIRIQPEKERTFFVKREETPPQKSGPQSLRSQKPTMSYSQHRRGLRPIPDTLVEVVDPSNSEDIKDLMEFYYWDPDFEKYVLKREFL